VRVLLVFSTTFTQNPVTQNPSGKLLFRFASSLDYLKIRKFITYWSLEAVNIKKSLIISGMTIDKLKLSLVRVLLFFFSASFIQNPVDFLGITRLSEP